METIETLDATDPRFAVVVDKHLALGHGSTVSTRASHRARTTIETAARARGLDVIRVRDGHDVPGQFEAGVSAALNRSSGAVLVCEPGADPKLAAICDQLARHPHVRTAFLLH